MIAQCVEASQELVNAPCPDTEGMGNSRVDVQLHESTVNCLAFCKALCDDFVQLKAQQKSILLICTMQITAVREWDSR